MCVSSVGAISGDVPVVLEMHGNGDDWATGYFLPSPPSVPAPAPCVEAPSAVIARGALSQALNDLQSAFRRSFQALDEESAARMIDNINQDGFAFGLPPFRPHQP